VKRLLGAAAAAAALSGCSGTEADEPVPAEDPGRAMVSLIRHELAGRLGQSWALLVREQRQVVARGLYVRCPNGDPVRGARIVVLGVHDEMHHVPALGRTQTKAVRWRLTIPQPGSEPVTLSRTGHLVAQDGRWRWTLSPASFASLRGGNCP
jgi:hypothetical protein